MRLDKLLSRAGFGTRKDVKQLLKKRSVYVDNKVTTKGDRHVELSTNVITVDGKTVIYEEYVYLMLHKPPNYLSATVDKHEKTVIDLVPKEFSHYQLFPVGRLDKDTEGLLLLTNDGQLNHLLTSPKKEIVKTYFAKIEGMVLDEHIGEFKDGLMLDDGYHTKPAMLTILKSDQISEIEITITEGKYHQVKRMFGAIGLRVIYLKRIQMGEIILDTSLPLGKIRTLKQEELNYLMRLKK